MPHLSPLCRAEVLALGPDSKADHSLSRASLPFYFSSSPSLASSRFKQIHCSISPRTFVGMAAVLTRTSMPFFLSRWMGPEAGCSTLHQRAERLGGRERRQEGPEGVDW
jgi:hypothetical protein